MLNAEEACLPDIEIDPQNDTTSISSLSNPLSHSLPHPFHLLLTRLLSFLSS